MKIRRSRDRGSALLISLVITIAVIGISGAFISHSMIRQRNSMQTLWGAEAVTAAEAGAALYVQDLNKSYWGTKATPPFTVTVPPSRFGFLGSDLTVSGGATQRTTAWVDQTFYRVWQEALSSNGIDDNSNGSIDDSTENMYRRLWVEGYAGGRADVSDPSFPKYIGGVRRTLEVVLTHVDGGVFWNAIFAGNKDRNGVRDLNYTMNFGGASPSVPDDIRGDIYSGGSLNVVGQAALKNDTGTGPAAQAMYNQNQTDTSSTTDPTYLQGEQPIPDISGTNYAGKAKPTTDAAGPKSNVYWDSTSTATTAAEKVFVDVDYELTSKGALGQTLADGSQGAMGNALQIANTSEPAHIFRKDPTTSTGTTQKRVEGYSGMMPDKSNFFLEDPTKTSNNGGTPTAPWGSSTGDTGLRVEVTPTTNNKVYYIDGNLWASNGPAYTFQWLNSASADMKITIVVKGNVYLTDNVIYDKLAQATGRKDALAIIAINDPAHLSVSADDFLAGGSQANTSLTTPQARIDAARDWNKLHGSGNIFFGDPGGGTTERFESFLFAENNFYDNNLGASGTLQTNIYGNMTAGNQVQINRNTSGAWKPLLVQFDNRLKTGAVTLPGLPQNPATSGSSWVVASWRQVASRPNNWAGTGGGFTFSPP